MNTFFILGRFKSANVNFSKTTGNAYGEAMLQIKETVHKEISIKIIPVKFFGALLESIDDVPPGTPIIVWGRVSAREYEGKWYLEMIGTDYSLQIHASRPAEAPPATPNDSDEDLPF